MHTDLIHTIKSTIETSRWFLTSVLATLLVILGCDSQDRNVTSAEPLIVTDDVGETAPDISRTPPGFHVYDGVTLAQGLIPELSEIPLPDGPVVFQTGTAYSAKTDPRETAVQTVHFTISPQELFDFYLSSLVSAGFKIKSSVDAFSVASQAHIEFIDAKGVPGRLFFRPGAWSESQMNINLYRSGSVD